jgi:Tfp pilus assembly protein PilX
MRGPRRKGAALVIVLSILFTLSILASTLVAHLAATLKVIEAKRNRVKAFHIAEGGIHKALWELAHNPHYHGEAETALGGGFFTVRVEPNRNETNTLRIISTGRLDQVDARHPKQTIAVVVKVAPEGTSRSLTVIQMTNDEQSRPSDFGLRTKNSKPQTVDTFVDE